MNIKYILLIIAGFVFFAVVFILWQYVFNIYEVTYSLSQEVLYADGASSVTIECIPLNAFGKRTPWRKAPAHFEITSGGDKVEIIKNDPDRGVLVIKALNQSGSVTVRVKSKFSLLPTEINIEIMPNAA